MKLLIIEDENEIRDFLVNQFNERGFDAIGIEDGDHIISKLEKIEPQVIILDQMMPGKSGWDVLKEIRFSARFGEVPVIMLTGLDGESEKVRALDMGADDYITKPFGVKELVARVNALLRRVESNYKKNQKVLVVNNLEIDFAAHKVLLSGQEVALTLTEFKILGELVKKSGQVLSRDSLRERALGNLNVTDRTIDVHMASLRKKLDSVGDSIETVRGVGYRLNL